jgi:hypothetical protein
LALADPFNHSTPDIIPQKAAAKYPKHFPFVARYFKLIVDVNLVKKNEKFEFTHHYKSKKKWKEKKVLLVMKL